MNKSTTPQALDRPPLVLVIEDEPGDAHLIRRQLLERGDAFTVHLAESLGAARALIDDQGLRPDVILLDLDLPDSSGAATVERCRLLVDAPIVVLTGLDDALATQAAIQSGAQDYLTKGGEASALRRAVRYAILRYQRDADTRLAATVFAHTREGISIADAQGLILDVNDAFTRITGYSRSEALGQNPRLLKSGRHDQAFYVSLWSDLKNKSYWSGEIWNRRKNGEVYAEMLTISAVRGEQGQIEQYVALFSDITERKAMEEQIRQLAFYDALTGLPNRRLLHDRLGQAMASGKRSGLYAALMFFDLDKFKPLNDTHGHGVGDLLLIEVAKRLLSCVREVDTVARFGGDEFVVMLGELTLDKSQSTEQARAVAEKIRVSLAAAYLLVPTGTDQTVRMVEHHCSASIGVVVFSNHESSQDDILKWGDAAMYRAKEAGCNAVCFHDPQPGLAYDND